MIDPRISGPSLPAPWPLPTVQEAARRRWADFTRGALHEAQRSRRSSAVIAAKRAPAAAKMPVSDAAVKAKTGRTWAQWCAVLDRAKADAMSHREIASMLHAKFDVGDWWAQMVTVGYERAKGKRAVNQTAQGFRTNISRTIPSPASAVYAAWHGRAAPRRLAPAAALHDPHDHRRASRCASPGPTARMSRSRSPRRGRRRRCSRCSTGSSPVRPRCAAASPSGRSASMRSATRSSARAVRFGAAPQARMIRRGIGSVREEIARRARGVARAVAVASLLEERRQPHLDAIAPRIEPRRALELRRRVRVAEHRHRRELRRAARPRPARRRAARASGEPAPAARREHHRAPDRRRRRQRPEERPRQRAPAPAGAARRRGPRRSR